MPIVHPCNPKLVSLSAVLSLLAKLLVPLAYPCWHPATVGKLRGFDGRICELMQGRFVIYSRLGGHFN